MPSKRYQLNKQRYGQERSTGNADGSNEPSVGENGSPENEPPTTNDETSKINTDMEKERKQVWIPTKSGGRILMKVTAKEAELANQLMAQGKETDMTKAVLTAMNMLSNQNN